MRVTLLVGLLLLGACAESEPDEAPATDPENALVADAEEVVARASTRLGANASWTGDLPGMVERDLIRVGTTFSRTLYFLDAGEPKGAIYEMLLKLEERARRRLGEAHPRLKLFVIPMARDELLPALTEGRVDLIASNLTITPSRMEQVDFSIPIAKGVREVVVSGPGSPVLASLDDLAGRELHVRRSSSYFESLTALSAELEARGLAPIRIGEVDERLESEDILELVAAGALPATVVDGYLAMLWGEVLDGLEVHDELAVGEGGQIAWAFRKGSPELAAFVNGFVREHRRGTLFGNVLFKRYFEKNRWVRNPVAPDSRDRFERYRGYFERYAAEHELDWLLIAAQGFQESRLEQDRVSSAGAVGIMQIKPSTAADPNVGIPDIDEPENNIRAGIKYLAFIRDRYFSDESLEKLDAAAFALAAYNAGPARIRRARKATVERGLDPNLWFRNVEYLAPRETVTYVGNIFKYYVSYRADLRRAGELAALEQLAD